MALNYNKDFGGAAASVLSRSSVNLHNRPIAYQVTGAGRDSYIGRNNGGLTAKYQPAAAGSIGTFAMPN